MNSKIKDHYLRCSPYCLKKMSDGSYLALNREYLPLNRSRNDVGGFLQDAEYNNMLEDAHKTNAVLLSSHEVSLVLYSGDENMFWLYKDGCAPWRGEQHKVSYDKRVELVPSLKSLV